jgi:hypothetical protein
MTATIKYLGSMSVGAAFPLLLAASAQLAVDFGTISATVALQLPEIEAKLKGLLSMQVSLGITPPSLTAGLEVAANLAASLSAAIAIAPPTLSASIALSGVLALIAQLEGLVVQLNAQIGLGQIALDLSLKIQDIIAAVGLRVYLYEGTLGELSSTIAAQICGPGGALGPLGLEGGIGAGVPLYLPLLVAEANGPAKTALQALLPS